MEGGESSQTYRNVVMWTQCCQLTCGKCCHRFKLLREERGYHEYEGEDKESGVRRGRNKKGVGREREGRMEGGR